MKCHLNKNITMSVSAALNTPKQNNKQHKWKSLHWSCNLPKNKEHEKSQQIPKSVIGKSKTYSPKWWCKIVKVKHHPKKQTKVHHPPNLALQFCLKNPSISSIIPLFCGLRPTWFQEVAFGISRVEPQTPCYNPRKARLYCH